MQRSGLASFIRASRLMAAAYLVGTGLWACSAESPAVPDPRGGVYHTPDSPDSVLHNVVQAYRNLELEPFTALLASDFRFHFTPLDADALGISSWSRVEETAATEALFSPMTVLGITLTETHGSAEPSQDLGHPPGTQRIVLTAVGLRVTGRDDTIWLADTVQDLYFRPGLESLGEDPNRWYLLEWWEIEPPSAPELDPRTEFPTPVQAVTWGGLKARFLD